MAARTTSLHLHRLPAPLMRRALSNPAASGAPEPEQPMPLQGRQMRMNCRLPPHNPVVLSHCGFLHAPSSAITGVQHASPRRLAQKKRNRRYADSTNNESQ
jgi:hypothetical protein